jgi:hypothetical protein
VHAQDGARDSPYFWMTRSVSAAVLKLDIKMKGTLLRDKERKGDAISTMTQEFAQSDRT